MGKLFDLCLHGQTYLNSTEHVLFVLLQELECCKLPRLARLGTLYHVHDIIGAQLVSRSDWIITMCCLFVYRYLFKQFDFNCINVELRLWCYFLIVIHFS